MSKSKYKYDIAFSLCKEDVKYVRKLIDYLNPNLNIFFYEENQEEIVGKSGPEVFAKVFARESRLVVIIHRVHWGHTYYTALEKNAIVDRTINEYDGIMLIPIDNSKPDWYPLTRIYVDPAIFPVSQIASFIEYRFTELDGKLEPPTLENRIQKVESLYSKRKKEVEYLRSPESFIEAIKELGILCSEVNSSFRKCEKSSFIETYEKKELDCSQLDIIQRIDAYFVLNNIRLNISASLANKRAVSQNSQSIQLTFNFLRRQSYHSTWQSFEKAQYYFNTDLNYLKGWSKKFTIKGDDIVGGVYLESSNQFYLLKDILNSKNLSYNYISRLFDYAINEKLNTIK